MTEGRAGAWLGDDVLGYSCVVENGLVGWGQESLGLAAASCRFGNY